ncbi:MAG: molybdenum ABC transporter ATP-binding protein [Chloroflexota bacterium]|nr:molybdenum ABC transporter ATP-binding protein [Chloroflexota bacterium]
MEPVPKPTLNSKAISFDVSKHYDEFSLKCNAVVTDGITALFGPSGSGKTTLLNCITGMDSPDSGWVEVMGKLIYSSERNTNIPPERRRFGYLVQHTALFPHMDVLSNINYGYKLTRESDRTIDPNRLINLFKLKPLLHRNIDNLSGGEQRRVGLARAMATSPNILILDEPSAFLDWSMRGVMLDYLRTIHEELGTPIIFASHSLTEILTVAESIIVLSEGKILAQGPPTQVFVDPSLSKLAEIHSLENLFPATVHHKNDSTGMTTLKVSGTELITTTANSESGEILNVSIKSEDVILATERPRSTSARNIIKATVDEITPFGHHALIKVNIGIKLAATITKLALSELELKSGQGIYLIIQSSNVNCTKRTTE